VSGDDASWIAGAAPVPGRYAAKTRYRQADAACELRVADAAGRAELVFDAPQWAVTPGQSVVLYDGEVCLGGAVIDASDAPTDVAARPARRRERPSVVSP
jgi:tRNA-specific 2-thiouridylase